MNIPEPIDGGNSMQGATAREAWRLPGIMSEFAAATGGESPADAGNTGGERAQVRRFAAFSSC